MTQESRRAELIAAADRIPKDMSPEDRALLEKHGFVLEGDHSDKLFHKAKLPKNWKMRATEHALWAELVDHKGRRRGGIFFKAEDPDRHAHLSFNHRYGVDMYVASDADGKPFDGETEYTATYVTDCGKPLKFIGVCARNDFAARKEFGETAQTWLEKRFPDWRDAGAYWDD